MSTPSLSRKKHVRAGHRASATKAIKRSEDVLADGKPDIDKLEQLKLTLKEKLEVLKVLDGEVLDMVEEDHMVAEIEQADGFKDGMYASLVRIERALTLATTAVPSPTPVMLGSSVPGATSTSSVRGGSHVKLPKLAIKPFGGELTAWTPFWESYCPSIHDNPNLTDAEKFNYLRSLLECTALDSISGLSLTAPNYKEAVAVLERRFGNKQQIIAKHMDALMNLEAVTSQHKLKGLRRLYDGVELHTRSLKSLGVESGSYGGLLASVLLNKLPQEFQLLVSRKIGEGEWKLDEMMKVMEEEIRARERTGATASPTMKKPTKEPPTAAALLTGGGSGPSCSYCQQAHSSNSCQVVTQPQARKQVLLRAGRCFVCLRRGHISRECQSRSKCYKCGGRHHVSVCLKGSDPQPTSPVKTVTTTPSSATQNSTPSSSALNAKASTFQSQNPHPTTSLWVNSDRPVLLQTAQAIAFNPDAPQKSRLVRIVLDCGSQRSFITEQVTRELSLTSGGGQPLRIMTFGSSDEKSRICGLTRLSLVLKSGESRQLVLYSVPLISEPLTCHPVSCCPENFDHLAGLDLADPSDGSTCLDVDLLIGSDQYWDLVTGETRRGKSGPVALNTELGWILSGPVASPAQDNHSTCLIAHTLHVEGLPQDSQALDDRLKSFWELEAFGILGPERSIHDEFESSIRFVDGRYEVELPWKEAHPPLPDNYQLCVRRLYGLLKRLKHDPDILREYNATIQDQLRQGIVEVVEPSEEEIQKIHYLPHHAVVRRSKETTKVRVVYDASARSDGPSLNECLHTGPKFEQKILDILLRFRVCRVAVTADVEKAFLMVSVVEKDRDVLRFLWVDDVLADQPNITELRFTRVVFGVSPSPFLLNATIWHHLEQYEQTQPDLVKRLKQSLYVDDLVTGADDEERVYQMYMDSKGMLRDGGFNLRKFRSNSATLQARVEADTAGLQPHGFGTTVASEETYASSTLGPGQKIHPGEQKVLGVRWDVSSDQIVVDLDEIAAGARSLEPTKRNVVSVVGKFYDPLGILAPVVVQFKMFFQELCEAKLEWDQPLPKDLLRRWQSLKTSLEEGQPIAIPRCYLDGVSEELITGTLCGFCDASLKAYAGVVYLLLETRSGFSVKFVAAKTRVSPLNKQTIPRLELLSAVLLSRLLTSVTESLRDELPLSLPRCYTDSTVALCWIKGSDKTWKPFVQNRVDEIRKLVPTDSWKHCSGRDNPADIPSRGLAPLELSVSVLWRNGPVWLKEGEPGGDAELQLPMECLAEMRVKDRQAVHGLLTTDGKPGVSQIIECKKFSSLDQLLATTNLVLKFCGILLDKVRPDRATGSGTINATAEELWILECQQLVAADKNFKQLREQLGLFQDENGLWRCGGRIQNAAVPYTTKHPALLHKSHYLTGLIVKKAHSRVLHGGVKATLVELRSKFWIIKGRTFVKGIIHKCRVCRRHEGRPYSAPPPPPLPTFRVEEAPPFSFTGVDFAGPLYIKCDGTSRKVWICLYTCCVVRAVHLDLVPDLSTPTFLRSFKRFVARRGFPSKILSDNGKTFLAAAKSIREVKWMFNVPKAPWWGGVFERMVKSTKRCLRKILGQAKFSYDELLTAITEVEMVVNSRPLSYVSAGDLEEPLTPSHLMVGRRLMNAPDNLGDDTDQFDVNPDDLTRRARYLNFTIAKFWERWRKEYLVELREAHRQRGRNSHAPRVSVGDVVIIHSDDQPRGMWNLGKVEELLIGSDGEARGAVLRVAGPGRRAQLLRRPVQRLYPLEMPSQLEDAPGNSNEAANNLDELDETTEQDQPAEINSLTSLSGETSASDPTPPERPRRAAASEARDRLLAQALHDEENC
jgi:hypothetical protein